MDDNLKKAALDYHQFPRPGKLEIHPTKVMSTRNDLALAYSPGVAHACTAIAEDANSAFDYTARGNLVGVVSNGTAVLGLGNIGALASKPVMEGKAVLFKKFSGIDVFDIEIDELDPQALIDTVARLEPTFGGINLEDIKAPDCFIVERELRQRMNIPVFHDDQHGTAIVVAAAVINGLRLVEKDIAKVKLVASGAGAAALSCIGLLVTLGLKRENIWITDIEGVVYRGRTQLMDEFKSIYAQDTQARTLDDVIDAADVFLGLSAGGVLKPAMVEKMAAKPIIMALANPNPEILPEDARAVRPDAILATGRSDYPNQVNNVLCFPFMFRGALDVGATTINEEMKAACVYAIADLAHRSADDVVRKTYASENLKFGPEYLIPKPFDKRLISAIAPAVAKAAMESGVATRPIADLDTYRDSLNQFVYRSGLLMKPVFEAAQRNPKRVIFAEGHRGRILMAAQQIVDQKLAHPILVGRVELIEKNIAGLGLNMRIGADISCIDPQDEGQMQPYIEAYQRMMQRKGVTPEEAQAVVHGSQTAVASLALHHGDGDAMICGRVSRFHHHLRYVRTIVGMADGVQRLSTMAGLIMPSATVFICDTHVNPDPSCEQIVESTLLAAAELKRMGVAPRVALLSYSNFGTSEQDSPRKMRRAYQMLREVVPDLEVDGEMHADIAFKAAERKQHFPHSTLIGNANLLVMPNLEAANITYNLLRALGGGVSIGPIMLGTDKPAHIVDQSVSVRGLLNMTAVAVLRAQQA